MALDQSALLELLAQLKLTDVTDRIRSAIEMLYQELIVPRPSVAGGPSGGDCVHRRRTVRADRGPRHPPQRHSRPNIDDHDWGS
ncbi:MAG: transposase [Frondihabitans sp.]|nr:transposase [Frondihabitans sp.]